MNPKRPYLLLIFLLLGKLVSAQISPLADQYLINPFLTNPAVAGTSKRAPVSIAARQQWVGMTGAPSWQSATWHASLGAKKQHYNPRGFINKGDNAFGNVGVGAGVFNVKYGAIIQIGMHVDYAYHIYLGRGRLSFGLAPMYQQFIINKSGFILPDGNDPDPMIDGASKEILHFVDVNAGVHYYSDKLFGGFSVVQLLNSKVTFGELSYATNYPVTGGLSENPYLARSFYVYGGLTPSLGDNLKLEPSAIVKYNAQNGLGFQINLRATINENFQFGLLYHYQESVGFFAGIKFTDLIFRYQFEAPFGKAVITRFTTHQVMIGYLLQ